MPDTSKHPTRQQQHPKPSLDDPLPWPEDYRDPEPPHQRSSLAYFEDMERGRIRRAFPRATA